uniref:Ig-like domain-containing protein n=1 Tax=Oreochromis niloticus TaxID=8128 RepID=A0A669F5V1_ORENI
MILSFNAEGTMKRCLLALSLLSLWTLAMEDTEESCNFMERCVLPCSFQIGKEIVIHWFKTPRDLRVHSYYHSKNQFGHQDQRFRNRTSVFQDQIRRGNASLQLTSVEVQDEGRYKCHTSTIKGNQESFVNLKVDAPVKEVSLDQVENWISCRSEGIYPEPQLSWSTSPPSNITFTNTTTVERTEQHSQEQEENHSAETISYQWSQYWCNSHLHLSKHFTHQLQPRLEIQPHSDHREPDWDQLYLLGVRRVEGEGEECV